MVYRPSLHGHLRRTYVPTRLRTMSAAARVLSKRGEGTQLSDEVDECVRQIVVDTEARLLRTLCPRVVANPTWQRLMAHARRALDDDRTVIGEESSDDEMNDH